MDMDRIYLLHDRAKDLDNYITSLFDVEPKSRDWDEIRSRRREYYSLISQIELLKGIIYDTDKAWVTEIKSDSFNNMKAAKADLLDKLSKTSGITIIGENTIQVLTRNKKYIYEIHAHKVDNAYQAWCSKNISNSFRTEYFWEE